MAAANPPSSSNIPINKHPRHNELEREVGRMRRQLNIMFRDFEREFDINPLTLLEHELVHEPLLQLYSHEPLLAFPPVAGGGIFNAPQLAAGGAGAGINVPSGRMAPVPLQQQQQQQQLGQAGAAGSSVMDTIASPSQQQQIVPKARMFPLHMDVCENDKAFIICADVPGISKEDCKISLKDNVLTIAGERKQEQFGELSSTGVHKFERRHGAFTRSLQLPATVECDKIEATCVNGVLKIMLPKKPQAQPKDIVIK